MSFTPVNCLPVLPATTRLFLDLAGIVIAGNGADTYLDDGDHSGATTISFAAAAVHRVRLTGAVTFTFTGATAGEADGLTLYLVQDGTGGRLVTWPASVKWPKAIVPVLSATANAIDIVVLETFNGGTSWFANFAGKAYA